MATPQGQPPITTATVSTMAKASRRVIVMSLPRRPSPSSTAWQGDAGQAIAGDASKNPLVVHRVLGRHVWASLPWFARPCPHGSSPDRGAHRICYAYCCAKTIGKSAVPVVGLVSQSNLYSGLSSFGYCCPIRDYKSQLGDVQTSWVDPYLRGQGPLLQGTLVRYGCCRRGACPAGVPRWRRTYAMDH